MPAAGDETVAVCASVDAAASRDYADVALSQSASSISEILPAATKQGRRYLRWALAEAATHACTHPAYRHRYQQTKTRIGKQRGAKLAQIDLARRLTEAIRHMLSPGETFAPKGATDPLAA